MKELFLSRDQSREIDRIAIEEYGMPGVILMENAGRGAVDYLFSLNVRGPVIICCGKGNNAGDGFVMARHLDNHSIPTSVILCSKPEELKGDAAINYHILSKAGVRIEIYNNVDDLQKTLHTAEWIVDALFGTGLEGIVKQPYADIIQTINSSTAKILAVDIPSGLDCDSGEPLGIAIKAHHTVTFGSLKKGFAAIKAHSYLGQVKVVDIGVPRKIWADILR